MAAATPTLRLGNAEIARRLSAYAQHLQGQGDNPFKVRAYRRAAQTIKGSRESFDSLVRNSADITRFPGIGKGIAAALREIVFSGTIGQLEIDLTAPLPEQVAVNDYPALDLKKVARVFKHFKIDTVAQLKAKLQEGAIASELGRSLADHVRFALRDSFEMLLDDADTLVAEIRQYLVDQCGVSQAEIAGDVRRRVEKISLLVFVIETVDFDATLKRFAKFRGGTDLIETANRDATFQLPGSVMVELRASPSESWGTALVVATGSPAHIEELERVGGLQRRSRKEEDAYRSVGLDWVPPELREGRGEVALAARSQLPRLVTLADIRGDLHMHTVSSDGVDTIERMAEAAQERGYAYLGITDHSQSLKIARGVSIDRLWTQIHRIDKLNQKGRNIRILKSAEVDILADGSLDYPNDLLAALDYTICSIHSRFRLGKKEQTERIMRAMDHSSFTILGHATGRLILHRTGYEIDLPRIIEHAKARGCYFEINADPDRLDLSAEDAQAVAGAGIKMAIGTDAHRAAGLDYMRCGIDVARRGGLEKADVLNTLTLSALLRQIRR